MKHVFTPALLATPLGEIFTAALLHLTLWKTTETGNVIVLPQRLVATH